MDTSNDLTSALREAIDSLKKLTTVFESAVNALRDKDEELRIVHDTNTRLGEQNADLRKRGDELGNDLYAARREARDAQNAKAMAETANNGLTARLNDAQDECKRLREMILNVAVAIEAAGLTPSKAMQEVQAQAAVNPTSPSSPVSEVTGSVSGSGSDGGVGGVGETPKATYSDRPFWEGQPRDPATGQFKSPYGH